MTMTCIKTGCHMYLDEYSQYAYGDAHEINGVLVLRISGTSFAPMISGRHKNHGYEGIEGAKEPASNPDYDEAGNYVGAVSNENGWTA